MEVIKIIVVTAFPPTRVEWPSLNVQRKVVLGGGDSAGCNDSYAQNGRAGVRVALSKRYEQQIKVLLV